MGVGRVGSEEWEVGGESRRVRVRSGQQCVTLLVAINHKQSERERAGERVWWEEDGGRGGEWERIRRKKP